ncbi:putative DNA-binding transcriptional regulator YafY [Kribbella amoyensis]|uniref:Putative DNA-binding transcriptional regulator YafY n=1 Tax=Kribbella amoyensis TaxID=996641 RepID=A0A561B2Q7_9ACTN|nr:YafY family protein [Kribbella amoyensis]TWD73145.1 putative DNA-binding transcriptional regulator YafY [Kribbella amoyensis]
MLETSARLLRLLSLLQVRVEWGGPELAGRLGVSTRTLRADVEKLRNLGYPVEARPGVAGGYRLGAGAALPPLLLDDDEAVAVAVGLRTAAAGGVAGIEESSVRALVKLEQVLPSRLRHRVRAIQAATVAVSGNGPTVDAEVLTVVAGAIRANERLRFDYVKRDRSTGVRTVEPHRLVAWGQRWYLVAWDNERDDWRTFRVDRIAPKTPNGPRFTPRELPEEDVAEYVKTVVGKSAWQFRANVRVYASAEYVQSRMPIPIDAEVLDDGSCVVEFGSDTPDQLALWLGMLDCDFEVHDKPELSAALRRMGDRYYRAAGDKP